MAEKLKKVEKDYYTLYDSDGDIVASNNPKTPTTKKLSLKNCQAIANGYDLDELACNEIGIDISVINHIDNKLETDSSPSTPIQEAGSVGAGLYHQVKGFEIGFQKALELNNTKLYTLEDMMNCWNKALTFQDHKKTLGEYIQSLQQTEWDVEIEMEDIFVKNNEQYVDEVGIGNYSTHSKKPKLDAEGNLILKRI